MRLSALQIRARIAYWRSIDRSGLDRERRDIQPARLERLQAAFASMPAPTRDVFAMHRFDDLPYDRIAIRLGIEVDEVEAHIAAALIHLCRALDDDR
jgi:DNA-directed RNA polymerase specialized sigma24 family protein